MVEGDRNRILMGWTTLLALALLAGGFGNLLVSLFGLSGYVLIYALDRSL